MPVKPVEKMILDLRNKKATVEQIAARAARNPGLAEALVAGMGSDRADMKFGCGRILTCLSLTKPEAVYPRIDGIIPFLDHANKILRWTAMHIIGNLAACDSAGKIERILGRYLEPIPGPDLVSAANAIGGAAKIALAKPRLAARIVKAVMGVESARYATRECRNVALGQAIDALESLYSRARAKAAIAEFVKKHVDNPRPSTAEKARKFAERLALR